jgi:hypothetical protein
MNTATDLGSLDLDTLRTWTRDAVEAARACMPGTELRAVRQRWADTLRAELTLRYTV